MGVRVRSYSDKMGAELGRLQLEEQGITAAVVESAGFNPIIGQALGVDLVVAEEDAQRAEEILSRYVEEAEDEADEPGAVRCPRCEMEYCHFGRRRLRGVNPAHAPTFAWLSLLAWPVRRFFSPPAWHCSSCGNSWADREAGPKKRTPLPEGAARPTFRMRRARRGTGLLVGVTAGVVIGVAGALGPLALVVMLLGSIAGWAIGGVFQHDVCSTPDCRVLLDPGLKQCPKCRGEIRGKVRSTEEHFIESARVRRELAAAPPRKGRRKKASKRGASEGEGARRRRL